MISMTKLYSYLNLFLWAIVGLLMVTILGLMFMFLELRDTVIDTSQFVQNSVDSSRQNVREDIQKIQSLVNSQEETIEIIRQNTVSIIENVPTNSWVTNLSNLQLVHYIAEVEVCTALHSSYKVKVDFYWINPRIESNRLLILDERLFANYEAYNVYFPILDKNTDSDADLCSIRIISSSNK